MWLIQSACDICRGRPGEPSMSQVLGGVLPMSRDVLEVELFAWIGEDELGSGEVGLKQGLTAAGMIPLVAVERGKVDREALVARLQAQADRYGKSIALVRFRPDDVLRWIHPAEGG